MPLPLPLPILRTTATEEIELIDLWPEGGICARLKQYSSDTVRVYLSGPHGEWMDYERCLDFHLDDAAAISAALRADYLVWGGE
jgi:hypothetical protein